MKNMFLFCMLFISVCGYFSCSSPNYSVSPNSLNNNSVNPLDKNGVKYDWSGTAPISALINGAPWVADPGSVSYYYNSSKYNTFTGNIGGKQIMFFAFCAVTAPNIYTMGWKIGGQYIAYSDSATVLGRYTYFSLNAMYGTGGVKIIRNDDSTVVPGYIEGKFFFEGIDSVGRIINVTNGYFNVQKW